LQSLSEGARQRFSVTPQVVPLCVVQELSEGRGAKPPAERSGTPLAGVVIVDLG